MTTHADLVALDSQDALGPYRARFDISGGLIYRDVEVLRRVLQ